MILTVLLGCVHEVSPELSLTLAGEYIPHPEPTTLPEWRDWVLSADPLARHPRLPATLLDLRLESWLALATHAEPDPSAWWHVEHTSGGTAAVAYSRGARLAGVEVTLGAPGALLRWIVPLGEPGPATFSEPRTPLAWAGDPSDASLLAMLERGVLLGWMDGPDIDVSAPAARLRDPVWARLAGTPVGTLLLARDTAIAGTPSAEALRVLGEATSLALEEAAADAPAEFTAVKARRAALADVNARGDVVSNLLQVAYDALAPHAADNEAAGNAMVAHAALRWRDRCADAPCSGFDRLPELHAAARFGPAPARLAATWRVTAWKGAVDEFWAAWGRPQELRAMDRIVELIAADDARALDLTALLRPGPDSSWILGITRGAGGPEGTSKEAVFRTLYGRVAREAKTAAKIAGTEAAVLGRIERRARVAAGG